MNLVCDEGVQKPIVEELRKDGHDVLYIAEVDPGIEDHVILELASARSAPVVTTDKDFGELVYRQGLATAGVILIRLAGMANHAKARIVAAAVRQHQQELHGAFTVISAGRIRIRRQLPPA